MCSFIYNHRINKKLNIIRRYPVLTIVYIIVGISGFISHVTGRIVNREDKWFHRPCIPRDFGEGSIVCVCNSTYCDIAPTLTIPSASTLFHSSSSSSSSSSFSSDEQLNKELIQIYTSTKSGQRLHKSILHFNREDEKETQGLGPTPIYDFESNRLRRGKNRVPRFLDLSRNSDFPRPERISNFFLSRRQRYQEVIGFGGSFTDAAGLNIASLSHATQENLMKSYFGNDGNDYTMGRIPMGGTDFSTHPYTYCDVTFQDKNLTQFHLQPEDYNLKIPYIKWAQLLTNKQIRLVASPWSAPVWMKTNTRLNGAGSLRKENYQVWADYYTRFINSYQKNNISIWGVTTGNEPLNGFLPRFPFNCMGWTASDMRTFIANHLGPTLKTRLKGGTDVKLITFDDNKGGLPTWGKEILEDSIASRYVDGIGTHWYFDFLVSPNILSRFHEKYPNYFIVQTEACLGFTPWELQKVILGSWERGEMYLAAIINDMKNWVGGWIDWNLALDIRGGPNWAKWAADSAILVNPKNDEFFKQPIHYGIGHVSKFVPPGSRRIEMSGTHVPKNLQSVAFLRPDNGTVIIFLNKLSYNAKVSLYDEERGSLFLHIPARSIQTLVYW